MEVFFLLKIDSVILMMRVMMKKVVYLFGIEIEDILVDLYVFWLVSVIVYILCKVFYENIIKFGCEVFMY